MSAEDVREKANENGGENKSRETQVAEAPVPFPLFPFGLFLLPLLIPLVSPTEQQK